MPAAAFPVVIAAVTATAAATLDTAVVTRGRDTSSDPGDFVWVGVSTLDAGSEGDEAGSFDQEFQTFGGKRLETGTVNLLALSRDGDGDADTACTAVFDLVAELCAAVRADPSLGVTDFDYLVTEVETGVIQELVTEDGAVATISLTVQYQARI